MLSVTNRKAVSLKSGTEDDLDLKKKTFIRYTLNNFKLMGTKRYNISIEKK